MRLDDFLSTVGLIKRRTVAKEMALGGLVKINNNRAKPAHEIKIGDVIAISGAHPMTVEVIAVPTGNVSKESREKYFRLIQNNSNNNIRTVNQ
jgi:ribosome-associated heat shock protein Hsp15